jgi:L-lactate dehydrogenase complex protein LldG
MNSRETILGRLREAKKPFPTAQSPTSYLPVSPLNDEDRQALTARFIKEAEALSCDVQLVGDEETAVQTILNILNGQEKILAWDFTQIPCRGLESALHEAGIIIAADGDDTVLCGITGAEAALAATGSLVVVSGPGRSRTTPLLPQTLVAIITQEQILPHMEAWLDRQRHDDLAAFKQSANINIISGPSRTADIAMELILGMHGPASVQIIIIENS